MPVGVESGTITVPATPMQESLWWVLQRARNKSVYNITWRLTCDRAVDVDALDVAWAALVARHEALRTSVVRAGDAVQMVVHPSAPARVRRVEADRTGEVDVDTLLRLIAEEAQEQEFTLDSESLARLTAVTVGDRHELLLTVHHLVLDGWGLQLVAEDLSGAYADAVAGRVPSFAADPVPFRVYATEQHDEAVRATWRAGLDHWRGTLDGAAATTVAADTDGDYVPGAPGVVIRHSFSEDACAGVAALAAQTYATPFAVFQGAMHIVLTRGGAGSDVTIGAVVANRMSERDQALVGYTANLCVSRNRILADDRVADVVGRARDTVWTMLMYQAVPYPVVFGQLSETTRRNLTDDAPLGLSHLGPIGTGLRLGDVGLTLQPSPNRAARADVSISTWEDGGRYHAEIEFNTARYTRDSVETLLADLDAVLAEGGRDPQRRVDAFAVRTRAVAAQGDHVRHGGSAPEGGRAEPAGGQRVTALWAEVLGTPPAGPDADFFATGGNSLDLLRLTAALEAETGVAIDVVEWLSEPTPRRLAAQLGLGGAAADPERAATTLATLREGTGPHVHLLHGAGAGPNDFRDVVAALPADWRVTASHEPPSEAPLETVPAMAARYRSDVDAAGLRPDLLCGWSMGGLVAYQMAAADPAPPALVLLDSPAPVGYPPSTEDELFTTFSAAFTGSSGDAAPPRTVADPGFRAGVLAAYLGATGAPMPAAVLAERWNAYARHARMGEAYVGPDRVPAQALLVGASLDEDGLADWSRRVRTPRVLRVDADHYGVLRGDTAAGVAAAIADFYHATGGRSA